MTKLITKRHISHMTNTVYNTESEKFETQDYLYNYWQHEKRVIMKSLAHWYICSALYLQYIMTHIYVVSAVEENHPISETGLFSSKYPCNLMAPLEISHNMRKHEDIKHVKVMALIIIKIQPTYSPQLLLFIYNFLHILTYFQSSKTICCIQCQ
jgi:hypothetical protein